jgi:hypothetical protein
MLPCCSPSPQEELLVCHERNSPRMQLKEQTGTEPTASCSNSSTGTTTGDWNLEMIMPSNIETYCILYVRITTLHTHRDIQ